MDVGTKSLSNSQSLPRNISLKPGRPLMQRRSATHRLFSFRLPASQKPLSKFWNDVESTSSSKKSDGSPNLGSEENLLSKAVPGEPSIPQQSNVEKIFEKSTSDSASDHSNFHPSRFIPPETTIPVFAMSNAKHKKPAQSLNIVTSTDSQKTENYETPSLVMKKKPSARKLMTEYSSSSIQSNSITNMNNDEVQNISNVNKTVTLHSAENDLDKSKTEKVSQPQIFNKLAENTNIIPSMTMNLSLTEIGQVSQNEKKGLNLRKSKKSLDKNESKNLLHSVGNSDMKNTNMPNVTTSLVLTKTGRSSQNAKKSSGLRKSMKSFDKNKSENLLRSVGNSNKKITNTPIMKKLKETEVGNVSSGTESEDNEFEVLNITRTNYAETRVSNIVPEAMDGPHNYAELPKSLNSTWEKATNDTSEPRTSKQASQLKQSSLIWAKNVINPVTNENSSAKSQHNSLTVVKSTQSNSDYNFQSHHEKGKSILEKDMHCTDTQSKNIPNVPIVAATTSRTFHSIEESENEEESTDSSNLDIYGKKPNRIADEEKEIAISREKEVEPCIFQPIPPKYFPVPPELIKYLEKKRKRPNLEFHVKPILDNFKNILLPKRVAGTKRPTKKPRLSEKADLPSKLEILMWTDGITKRRVTDITDLEVAFTVVSEVFQYVSEETESEEIKRFLKIYEKVVRKEVSETMKKAVALKQANKEIKNLTHLIKKKGQELGAVIDQKIRLKREIAVRTETSKDL